MQFGAKITEHEGEEVLGLLLPALCIGARDGFGPPGGNGGIAFDLGEVFSPRGADRLSHADDGADDQRGRDRDDTRAGEAVATDEFLRAINGARRARHDGLLIQVPTDVVGEFVSRAVTAVAVLFQTPHHDPIEISAEDGSELHRS